MSKTLSTPLEKLVPINIEKELDETEAVSLGAHEPYSTDLSATEDVEDDKSDEHGVHDEHNEGEGDHEEEDKGDEGEEGGEFEEKETGGDHVEIQPEESEMPPASPEISTQEDDETDDETDDESAFKKLEQDIQREYLAKFHPETKQINYDELLALCKVVRNSEGKIIDALHKTIPFMTKYERTRILGLRTTQINNGSEIFIKVDKDIIDGYTIALKELKAKKMPFIIRRPLPNGASEYWRVEDLEIINY